MRRTYNQYLFLFLGASGLFALSPYTDPFGTPYTDEFGEPYYA